MAWAPAHGISGGTTGIFDFFEEKVLSIAKELGRRPVLWEGAMDANLKSPQQSESGAVIEPWKCWSGLNTRSAATAAKQGLAAAMAAGREHQQAAEHRKRAAELELEAHAMVVKAAAHAATP